MAEQIGELGRGLRRAGMSTMAAVAGRSAPERPREQAFDLIFMNVRPRDGEREEC